MPNGYYVLTIQEIQKHARCIQEHVFDKKIVFVFKTKKQKHLETIELETIYKFVRRSTFKLHLSINKKFEV